MTIKSDSSKAKAERLPLRSRFLLSLSLSPAPFFSPSPRLTVQHRAELQPPTPSPAPAPFRDRVRRRELHDDVKCGRGRDGRTPAEVVSSPAYNARACLHNSLVRLLPCTHWYGSLFRLAHCFCAHTLQQKPGLQKLMRRDCIYVHVVDIFIAALDCSDEQLVYIDCFPFRARRVVYLSMLAYTLSVCAVCSGLALGRPVYALCVYIF